MSDEIQALAPEESLDPKDWTLMRALGHRMVDDMMDYIAGVSERPVWRCPPDEARDAFHQPLPRRADEPEAIYEDFRNLVLDFPLGNIHPRFWGWVCGSGTAFGMLAELLRAGMNTANVGHLEMANLVEHQVIAWCKEMLDYPPGASGLLVDGASLANLIGLTVARGALAQRDVRKHGLFDSQRMTLYASAEVHSSIQKAAELLGLGSESIRIVDTDARYAIKAQELERQIRTDRTNGHQPLCIVGTAGTVNTGAFDDLVALANIAASEQIWFHVDGAFGAFAALSPRLRHLVHGMSRADSLAFDLHKWMHMQYDVGCILVRSRAEHRRAFSLMADYIATTERGVAANPDWFSNYGPQLSRSFRALKVWMSIREHGIDKFARLIEQNVEHIARLEELIDATSELEVVAPASLNILNYRYVTAGLSVDALNQVNKDILSELQEQGIAVPSSTMLDGKFVLRIANTNHRTRFEDFELLVRESVRLGRQATGSQAGGRSRPPHTIGRGLNEHES
ncbi:MAG: pyridoxal phosphate-dependent decarboxylase family protein [Gammaproteobacteria bacterium]